MTAYTARLIKGRYVSVLLLLLFLLLLLHKCGILGRTLMVIYAYPTNKRVIEPDDCRNCGRNMW